MHTYWNHIVYIHVYIIAVNGKVLPWMDGGDEQQKRHTTLQPLQISFELLNSKIQIEIQWKSQSKIKFNWKSEINREIGINWKSQSKIEYGIEEYQ